MSTSSTLIGASAPAEAVVAELEVVIGVVGRPHGLAGDVMIDVRTDEPEQRFRVGCELGSEGGAGTLTVAAARWANGRLLVRFEQAADRTAAEALRGRVLTTQVDANQTPAEPDEFYDRQLRGLRVEGHDGTAVGEVTDVLHLPAQDLLEITTDTGTHLVPFVSALVPVVDLDRQVVQIADVSGLLEDRDAD